ncbi:MAG: hypothetical protein QMC73_03180 [Myxococcota bacterium]
MKHLILFIGIVLISVGNVALAEEEKAESTEAPEMLGAEDRGMSREALGDEKVVAPEEKKNAGRHHHKRHHGGKHPETCSENECTESECKHHSKRDEEHKPGDHKAGKHAECGESCKARHHGKRHGKDHGKRHGKGPRYHYNSCVDTATAGGSDKDEASRVCRSLFPAKDS